jgi:hypothetical protein
MTTPLTRRPALAMFVVGAFLSVSVGGGPAAHAAGSPSPSPSSSHGTTTTTYGAGTASFSLTVSPTRLDVRPADNAETQRIHVVNGGQAPMSVTVQKRNFTGDADGAMNFQATAPYSASPWVTVSPMRFTLTPGATQTVTAAISVPTNPEPGDHEVALVFLAPAGRTKANIKINRGIAIPAYITVPGPTSDAASPADLSGPSFATGGPVTISAQVNDTGTVHRNFRGATPLRITGAGSAAAFPDFTVMRDSTRDVSTTWNPPFMCICHPTVSIVDAGGVVRSASVRVIVFPVGLFAIVLAGLLVLAVAIRVTRRRYRASVLTAAARISQPVGSHHS